MKFILFISLSLVLSSVTFAQRNYSGQLIKEIRCISIPSESSEISEVLFRPKDLFVVTLKSGQTFHVSEKQYLKGFSIWLLGKSEEKSLQYIQMVVREDRPSKIIVRSSHTESMNCKVN